MWWFSFSSRSGDVPRDPAQRPEIQVHLCRDVVDFRKQMRGLSVLVQEELELDVFSSHLFAFCNRRRNHIRLLYWERNGFVMWQKKLEQDRFPWPRTLDSEVIELSGRELNWLLDGRDVLAALRPHDELFYETVLQKDTHHLT